MLSTLRGSTSTCRRLAEHHVQDHAAEALGEQAGVALGVVHLLIG